ncbi:MAG TPA: alcohol dehydrogenase catalytic domain-containing protein [Gaiellales bacterium]|nr:alcohol dehydrogenase catalytic domain-containing protein [Gaiellales bacterium]
MKALVYHGPDHRSWDSVTDPTIQEPSDIVVEIATTTICGSDLQILKGDVRETKPGAVLGHEAIGRLLEVGSGVSTVAEGDRVLLRLLRLITGGRLAPTTLITHRFGITDTMQAYDSFADAATTDALKVVLTGNTVPTARSEETAAAAASNGGLPRHLVHG